MCVSSLRRAWQGALRYLFFNSNQGNTCLDRGGSAGKITDIEADASPGSSNGMRQLLFGVRVVF
jgi:hypothetical protein